MKRVALTFSRLAFLLLFCGGVMGVLRAGALEAREFKKKTFEHEKPSIRERKGKETLRYSVVIKNTGTTTERFHVSAEAKAEKGVWLYGGIGRPTTVKAGQEKNVRISTRHQMKTIPKEIRVQVLQSYGKKTTKKKKN
jgi:hypothetical protein